MGVDPLKRAVFFDRDGILNEAVVAGGTPHPPGSLADLRLAAGADQAVRTVRELGFEAIVVTNQPDVARGSQSRATVEAMTAHVAAALELDAAYTCFHDSADGCSCRKPKPGLLLQAARERGIALSDSYLIGDRASDAACGRAAGCATIFVDRGYGETPANVDADARVASLSEAIAYVVERETVLKSTR